MTTGLDYMEKFISASLNQNKRNSSISIGVSFTSDGRQNSELDNRITKASAIIRQLHRSMVLKREFCTKAKLSIFRSVYVPILTYDHDCWIMNALA